jgi:tetratricopeptide (TPR) repeat protein
MRTLAMLFLSVGMALGQDAPPPAPPPVPVVTLDIAPLAPPDLASPYASPRDGARHRLQVTMSQLQATRNVRAAVQCFADAFAADRTYAAAAFNLGIVAAIAEKWSDALAAFEEAARLDPAGFGKLAAPSIERLRRVVALEASPEGKLRRRYDEALYPVIQKLTRLTASDAIQALAEVGRIDPKRWEAPALIASLSGDDRGYETAVPFLEIAAKNATQPDVKARLEKALDAARREQRYSAARSEADAAADRGEYEKAAGLYENAWGAMPARGSNGMEAASAYLLHDDTAHASALLARLREGGDPELAPLAGAMLAELEPVEPGAKAGATGSSRDFFRDPGSSQPVVIADIVPAVDTGSMELLARPLPKLVGDAEPVILLSAYSLNPAEAMASAALPELGAPKISAESPWREISQVPAARSPETTAPQATPAMNTHDISPAARVHRAIQVTSQPPGARIFKGDDAEPACETPCTLQAGLGSYSLQLHLPGYRPETREVQVAAKNVELEVSMTLIRASVLVDAPPQATLKVNGIPVSAQAPVELSLLPGLYRIAIESAGSGRERMVNLKPEARLRLEWKP